MKHWHNPEVDVRMITGVEMLKLHLYQVYHEIDCSKTYLMHQTDEAHSLVMRNNGTK